MNSKIIVVLIILIGVFAISHVNAEDNSAQDNLTDCESADDYLTVDNTDEKLNKIHYINSSDSIQETINSASENDTIVLNGSFSIDDTIHIDKQISIFGEGNGASISLDTSAFSKPRFFEIDSSASNVVLNNLIFFAGITNKNGGAICWNGDNGTLSNCKFVNNKAQVSSGGSLVLNGNNCNVTNCSFNGNHAENYGGAIVLNGCNCRINECNFIENYADTYGGAIFVSGSNNKISKCKFKGNYIKNINNISLAGGGAIFSSAEGLEIDNCNFSGNTVTEGNGGAVILGEYNSVQHSFFNDNDAALGKDIYCNSSSYVISNYFILHENKTKESVIYGISEDKLINNTFTIIKTESRVNFLRTGKIFTYGILGSLYITVKGGSLKLENIRILNHKEAKFTYSKNILTISNLAVGKYTLRVTTTPDEYHYSIDSDFIITINKDAAVITASKLTAAYKKSTKWTMKFVNSVGKPIKNLKVNLKVYTGKKYKKVTVYTNSKGIASYQTKNLAKGKHKVVVSASHAGYTFKTFKSTIKVIKQKALKFKVKRTTAKDGAQLSIQVFNKKRLCRNPI